jgi:hypothetical protein
MTVAGRHHLAARRDRMLLCAAASFAIGTRKGEQLT